MSTMGSKQLIVNLLLSTWYSDTILQKPKKTLFISHELIHIIIVHIRDRREKSSGFQFSPSTTNQMMYYYHNDSCVAEVFRNPGSHLLRNLVGSARENDPKLELHVYLKQRWLRCHLLTLNPWCVRWLDNIQRWCSYFLYTRCQS